eukprot:gene3309-2291_t
MKRYKLTIKQPPPSKPPTYNNSTKSQTSQQTCLEHHHITPENSHVTKPHNRTINQKLKLQRICKPYIQNVIIQYSFLGVYNYYLLIKSPNHQSEVKPTRNIVIKYQTSTQQETNTLALQCPTTSYQKLSSKLTGSNLYSPKSASINQIINNTQKATIIKSQQNSNYKSQLAFNATIITIIHEVNHLYPLNFNLNLPTNQAVITKHNCNHQNINLRKAVTSTLTHFNLQVQKEYTFQLKQALHTQNPNTMTLNSRGIKSNLPNYITTQLAPRKHHIQIHSVKTDLTKQLYIAHMILHCHLNQHTLNHTATKFNYVSKFNRCTPVPPNTIALTHRMRHSKLIKSNNPNKYHSTRHNLLQTLSHPSKGTIMLQYLQLHRIKIHTRVIPTNTIQEAIQLVNMKIPSHILNMHHAYAEYHNTIKYQAIVSVNLQIITPAITPTRELTLVTPASVIINYLHRLPLKLKIQVTLYITEISCSNHNHNLGTILSNANRTNSNHQRRHTVQLQQIPINNQFKMHQPKLTSQDNTQHNMYVNQLRMLQNHLLPNTVQNVLTIPPKNLQSNLPKSAPQYH